MDSDVCHCACPGPRPFDRFVAVALVADVQHPIQPVHVPWEARISGVSPMPGGYDGYLDSLRWVAESVQEAPPSRADLTRRIANRFGLTLESADNRVGFLRRVGLIQVDSGVVILPEFMKSWLIDGGPTSLMVQLHQRLRLVGEMLAALDAPMRTADLLQWACDRYGFHWTTSPQIDLRRGWLQSAGLMREESGLLYRTDAGTRFLDLVAIEEPRERQGGEPGTESGYVLACSPAVTAERLRILGEALAAD